MVDGRYGVKAYITKWKGIVMQDLQVLQHARIISHVIQVFYQFQRMFLYLNRELFSRERASVCYSSRTTRFLDEGGYEGWEDVNIVGTRMQRGRGHSWNSNVEGMQTQLEQEHISDVNIEGMSMYLGFKCRGMPTQLGHERTGDTNIERMQTQRGRKCSWHSNIVRMRK